MSFIIAQGGIFKCQLFVQPTNQRYCIYNCDIISEEKKEPSPDIPEAELYKFFDTRN